jgi:hypothetical protein
VREAESATPTGGSFTAVTVMVVAVGVVVVVPSLAETLKEADPLKFAAGVKVMPLRAVLALAMAAKKLMLAVPLPARDERLLVVANVIVPWVAVTVTVRLPPSVSLTDTPVRLRAVSSAVVRELPVVTPGTAAQAGVMAASNHQTRANNRVCGTLRITPVRVTRTRRRVERIKWKRPSSLPDRTFKDRTSSPVTACGSKM